MLGGDAFRDEIVTQGKCCDVFLLLLNEEWALSGECKDENALAKRLNLTSHERGRTKRTEPRLPVFIPVAFPNLNWSGHSHVELLAASTNFLSQSTEVITPDSPLLKKNSNSIQNAGFAIAVDDSALDSSSER